MYVLCFYSFHAFVQAVLQTLLDGNTGDIATVFRPTQPTQPLGKRTQPSVDDSMNTAKRTDHMRVEEHQQHATGLSRVLILQFIFQMGDVHQVPHRPVPHRPTLRPTCILKLRYHHSM
jgi:hypothetical protein